MAKTTISVDINTPVDMTIPEALQLFTDAQGYNPASGDTRAVYAKKAIAQFVKNSIMKRQRFEHEQSISAFVPKEVTVE